VVYEGAGHGFMRSGEDGSGSDADRQARDEAWRRWREILGQL
jgi:carboxymethylenebutenolidase